jgi:ABC-type transporter MlaC component
VTNSHTTYADALERYRALVADATGEKVRGKANPYTSMNGNMFSFLDKAGTMCLRLPDEDRKAFAAAFQTSAVVQYGAVMKEYVPVPPQLLADPVVLKGWFVKCLAYAQSLPAKPTSRE